MVTNERELEDYICKNQNQFISKLKDLYCTKEEIKFIGRQVNVGKDNRIDLLYYFDDKTTDNCPDGCYVIIRHFIVVELKYRPLGARDLAQIARYIAVLRGKTLDLEGKIGFGHDIEIHGVFVSFGLDDEMREISCADILNGIDFIKIQSLLEFYEEGYSKTEEYIKSLDTDERIERLYAKEGN